MKIYSADDADRYPSDRGSLHFGAGTAVRNAPAIAVLLQTLQRGSCAFTGVASGNIPFPARISCTSFIGHA